jgi:hypothetical protein
MSGRANAASDVNFERREAWTVFEFTGKEIELIV